ncbi:glycosyltransferase [Spirulina major CS-329]|uniref:glycosyltransferase n=1 Tax=Spirulina TaxID=1154 RepID=UPI00232B1094|nr:MULTISPECIES: glycosyltransferase [Spirulina]MDB9494016.1 glycosyltransferase [Spirulina subsalsa CS-330]MDB9502228.1 glycosyltransferase [Spirulina major CS-329]
MGLQPDFLEHLYGDWIQQGAGNPAADAAPRHYSEIDAVIVSDPRYLGRILTRYAGRVFYRAYDPPGQLSQTFWKLNYFRAIQERGDFWVLPCDEAALVGEHDWLKQRMRVVPLGSDQDLPLARVMTQMNRDRTPPPQPVLLPAKRHEPAALDKLKRLYVLFHFPGPIVRLNEQGQYLSSEGIPRVVRKFVEAVLAKTSYQVVITCRAGQLEACYGFFKAQDYPGRMQFLLLDPEDTELRYQSKVRKAWVQIRRQYTTTWRWLWPWIEQRSQWTAQVVHRRKNIKVGWLRFWQWVWLKRLAIHFTALPFLALGLVGLKAGTAVMKRLKVHPKIIKKYSNIVNRRYDHLVVYNELEYLETVNQDEQTAFVLVPHYYLFPESMLIKHRKAVYLPDYMPHFFRGQKFAGSLDRWHDRIGYTIVQQMNWIFTASYFSQSYLPTTVLEVEPEKMTVLPIPLLMQKIETVDAVIGRQVRDVMNSSQYLFYPTQDRPNKQLSFLLKLFKDLRRDLPDLKLVLTANIHIHPGTRQVYTDLQLQDAVILLEDVSDAELQGLYQQAAALAFTSTMEGNFPPQIFEALTLNTPVVATRIPLITEALGDASDRLLLCDPLDLPSFREKLLYALRYPQQVRDRQRVAYHRILDQYNDEKFADSVADFLANLP